jgi:hypothetical protein
VIELARYPAIPEAAADEPLASDPAAWAALGGSASGSSSRQPLSAVPVLSSLPGAPVTIYLDFDGDFTSSWGSYSNITTPAFDQDGDPSSFSNQELNAIRTIWSYVAEDYAPFDINVTTVSPGRFDDGVAVHAVIGGSGSWAGGSYGGLTYVDSFTNAIPNISFVFAANLGKGNAKYVGDAVSHEVGHAFGLEHQSAYSGSTKTSEYSTGPGNGTAPLMGNSYSARRSLWWVGASEESSTTIQDDIAVLTKPSNGIHYRPDEAGPTADTASPLSVSASGTEVSAFGIISMTTDVDDFSFWSGAGTVAFTVTVPKDVSNLTPCLLLTDAFGNVLASADPSKTDFSASITASLPQAGSYRVVVVSSGGYGNVGQYSLSGSIVAMPTILAAPTGLAVSAVSSSEIDLRWVDNALGEQGYQVERSTDGQNWTIIAPNLAADSTRYTDRTISPGTSYFYRVRSTGQEATSDPSSPLLATAVSASPGGLAVHAVSGNEIDVSWGDVSGEYLYQVERSPDGVSWAAVIQTSADVTQFIDRSVLPGITYQYRVRSFNASGFSAPGNVGAATTPSPIPVFASPATGLVAVGRSSTQIDLKWQDNSSNELGFVVQRSLNGGATWSNLAAVPVNATSFSDLSAGPRMSYVYRIVAYNTAGLSSPSNVAGATTPRSSAVQARSFLSWGRGIRSRPVPPLRRFAFAAMPSKAAAASSTEPTARVSPAQASVLPASTLTASKALDSAIASWATGSAANPGRIDFGVLTPFPNRFASKLDNRVGSVGV